MLTESEEKFIEYWEKNRENESKLTYQLLSGLPWGLLFSLPILINFLLGRFWYKRADAVGTAQFNPLVLVFAVLLITIFIGVFRKKFQWEERNQHYKSLMFKKNNSKNQ